MTTSEEPTTAKPDRAQSTDHHPLDEKKDRRRAMLRRMIVFFSLQISLFMAALDGTIVATSLPKIGSDFNSMAISSWVATSYILTQDVFQPILAKLSDIFGRKYILMISVGIFEIGSVLCATSKTMIMLIVCRAIQGIGAGGIFSMVFIVISDIVPLEKRGNYQGIINAVFTIAGVVGPLVGGSLTDQDLKTKLKRIDYAVLCAATLFLLALNFGGQTFPWASVPVILPLCISGALLGLLVVVELKYAKEPLMPPRLFKNRTVVCMLIVNILWGLVFFSVLYFIPIYFQVVRGDSAMWSGIRMIPMQIVVSVVSITSGRLITVTGRYRPMIAMEIYGSIIVGGVGMGCVVGSTVIACQAAVETRDIAVVTGLNTFSRMLGSALGVAISASILNSSLRKKLSLVIPMEYVTAVVESPEYVRNGLPSEYYEVTIKTYVQSLRLLWYILVAFMILAFVSAVLSKHHPLRRPDPPPSTQQPSSQKREHQAIDISEPSPDSKTVETRSIAAAEELSDVETAKGARSLCGNDSENNRTTPDK
ncbi:major facilitator superfamily domain-containing protein [Dichotomocladium elegans]|nr:major facilitator superfamily domain-containing protein [Dichotomocladium elegans]